VRARVGVGVRVRMRVRVDKLQGLKKVRVSEQ
jgi:hypothetical protein